MARTRNFADVIRRELAEDEALALAVEEAASEADIAAEIFAMRTAAGLTQSDLAKRVGTQQSVIARLEDADYSGHSLKMLRKIAWALGRTVRLQFPVAITADQPNEQKDDGEPIKVDLETWFPFAQTSTTIDDTDFDQIISEEKSTDRFLCRPST